MKEETNIGGHDAHERPRYSIAQAARYVQIAPATLRSWVVGRPYETTAGSRYFEPLIARPSPGDPRLSFSNLIEAHVLRSLRTKHEVPMSAVRAALDYAESTFRIERLLLSDELRTAAGTLLIERLDQLIDLGQSGQIVLKELLQAHLQRIERDLAGAPLRLYPVINSRSLSGPKIVGIDPQ
ncbi:MAG TPA: hypothetical protein VF414_13175, partial [Thermoanaerobaculia bacterium]